MDWKQIKKKNPKAWGLLCKAHSTKEVWGYIDNPDIWDMDGLDISHYELRHLYDFFDEHGIIIDIEYVISDMDFNEWVFGMSIVDISCAKRTDMKEYQTRKEAEKDAYLRAFEILERQL